MPTPLLQNNSPFELLFKKPRDYNFLRTFGSACWPNLHPYNSNKLQPRSLQCVFMGYSLRHKGYKCLHIPTGRLYFSRDVIFQEDTYPFINSSKPTVSSSESNPSFFSPSFSILQPTSTNSPCCPAIPRVAISPPHLENSCSPPMDNQSLVSSSLNSRISPVSLNATSPSTSPLPNSTDTSHTAPMPINTHHMMTRSKHQISKPTLLPDGTNKYPIPHALLTTTSLDEIEPTYHSTAIRHPKWRAAMNNEFDALLKNHTWTLVPSSTAQNLIGCKWVFRIKRKADGTIERYKARLIAKGFHQQPGIDYGRLTVQ